MTFEITFIEETQFHIGFEESSGFSVNFSEDSGFHADLFEGHLFEGETDFTPTDEVQTISTKGLVLPENIVINPIPSNYGHIAWNGAVLMVY